MPIGFEYENCRAVITGASSGLGAEFARQLAPHAESLLLVARRPEALDEVKKSLSGQKAQVQCLVADLGVEEGRQAVLAWAQSQEKKTSLLINNAGMGDYGSLQKASTEKTRQLLELNISALTLLTQGFLPLLARPGGIVNVSSLAGTVPMPELATYAASKAYVTSFSEALALEVEDSGITVTCLCPGPTPTNFSKTARRADGKDTDRSGQDLLRIPPNQVVQEALAALKAGKTCHYPGLGVRVASTIFRYLPRWMLRQILRRRMKRSKLT